MIQNLRVQNFKALKDVSLELTPIHLLIGPNDSGKTSILEAIDSLSRTCHDPIPIAFAGRWKGRELVWAGSKSPTVTIEATFEDRFCYSATYQFSPSRETRDAGLLQERCVTPRGIVPIYEGGPIQYSYLYAVSRSPHVGLPPPASEAALRVYRAIANVHSYRFDPKLLSLPVAADSTWRFRMEPNGFGLARCIDDILGSDRKLMDKIEKRLIEIFPFIQSIQLLPTMAVKSASDFVKGYQRLQDQEGKGIYFALENGAYIPATESSDGTLLILAFLTLLHLPAPPTALLIEEPENGIHPQRLRDVLQILRELVTEHQNQTQVLLTTHSPYVLDLFSPEEVTLCKKESDGSVSVHRLAESKTVRDQIDTFNLGEIWTAEGDDKLAATATPSEPQQ